MNAAEILKCIGCLGGKVLALNELDGLLLDVTKNAYLVVNTSSDMPGVHWTSVVVINEKNSRNMYYFDSLAIGPALKSHVDFCNLNIKDSLVFNSRRVQSPESLTCGLYCILFCHHMSRGRSFESFMTSFGTNLHNNDAHVREIFMNLPPIKSDSQSCRALNQLRL